MADTGLITYVLRDVDHGIADSVRFSAADEIESLERQIAELRAELTEKRRDRIADSEISGSYLCRLEAAEEENARLRALPLKDEGWRADFWAVQSKTGMHIGLWSDRTDADEAMRQYEGGTIMPLFKSSLLSRLRAGEQEGWRELPLPDPTSHASTSPGPVNCSIRKRCQGEAYPRTCERCSLGPCPFFHGNGEAKRLPAAPSEQGGDRG